MPLAISIISFTSSLYAQDNFIKIDKSASPIGSETPKEPKKQETGQTYMEAILPPRDEILEKIEIKYKR